MPALRTKMRLCMLTVTTFIISCVSVTYCSGTGMNSYYTWDLSCPNCTVMSGDLSRDANISQHMATYLARTYLDCKEGAYYDAHSNWTVWEECVALIKGLQTWSCSRLLKVDNSPCSNFVNFSIAGECMACTLSHNNTSVHTSRRCCIEEDNTISMEFDRWFCLKYKKDNSRAEDFTLKYATDWIIWLHSSLSIFTVVVGFLGNTIVIYILMTKQKKLGPGDDFICSLAFTDILSSVLSLLMFVLKTGVSLVWCKAIHLLGHVFLQASSLTLVAIAVERTRAIIRPFSSKVTTKVVLLITILIYAISIATSGVEMAFRTDISDDQDFACVLFIPTSGARAVTRLTYVACTQVLPMVLIGILYTVSIRSLFKQRKELQRRCQDSKLGLMRTQRDIKVTTTFVITFMTFFLLTSPYSFHHLVVIIYALVDYEKMMCRRAEYGKMGAILLPFLLLNSCVNPIIYAARHAVIRRYTTKILCRMFPCRRTQKRESTHELKTSRSSTSTQ